MIEAGNINATPGKYVLWVYDGKTLKPKASLVMPDDTVVSNEIMGEHYIQFSFNLNRKELFKRTDYLKYKGIIYRLREDCQPTEVHLKSYTYEPKFEAPEMFFQDCIMFYTMQGYKEVEWVLFGKAQQFIEIAVDNINTQLGDNWTVGIVEPTDLQNITFNGSKVFDALTDVAEAFGAEWYADYDNKTINLVHQHQTSDIVTLRRELELTDIKKAKDSEESYCNRLYAFGSTRNIPKDYREIDEGGVIDAIVQKKLRLPAEVGDYIDAYPDMTKLEIVPDVITFDEIYPKRIGNITSIRTVEKKDDNGDPFIVFFFKDSGLSFKSEYILPNETLLLQFGDNSWLAGRDFELSYNDKTEEFEIINQTEGENYIPNGILKPKEGDEYVLWGFDISLVGDQYVPEAEKELEEAAREYLEKIATDTATYTCTVNPVYRLSNDLNLMLGQQVRLKSLIFETGEKLSRVYGYRKYPATGKDEYVVGDVMDYKRLDRMDNKTDENKKIADVQYLEAMRLANGTSENVKALGYIRRALENETMIDKGLLLTTLIRLGAIVGDKWVEKAGINGAAMSADDVVAYFGGSLDEAIIGMASIIFKVDGSGQLAKGNIIWDALGNLLTRGKFESNIDGNKVIVDPDKRSIQLINDIGQQLMDIHFKRIEVGSLVYYQPEIVIDHFGTTTGENPIYTTTLSGLEVKLEDITSGYVGFISQRNIAIYNKYNTDSPQFTASTDSINNTLKLYIKNLPTDANGEQDKVYKQNGQLMIS